MCGIVGIVSRSPSEDRELLVRMRDRLIHRGPDDAGLWWSADNRVGFGHRRLSIIDLSPGGHQPMSRGNGRVHIIFNGEIYNFLELRAELESLGHKFTTHSDTEVLLEAYLEWGSGAVSRLNGMFAFALYDSAEKRLLLARDRAGEKPLFYFRSPSVFLFASELKALFLHPAFPRRISPEGLDSYLAYGYVAAPATVLEGVRKLQPGSVLELNIDTLQERVTRYWSPPEPRPAPTARKEELVDELEALLLDATRRQMIADVPLGILLSGGIDSSLVTAMAARLSSRPVRTFTISFPGHRVYNEAPFARDVASYFGTEHVELCAEDASFSLLPELVRQYDEPIADSSMIPTYLVSRLIRQHATVALGGDGGDELFGGYPHYNWLLRQQQWRGRIPKSIRKLGGKFAEQFIPVGIPGRNHLMGFSGEVRDSIAHINLYFDRRTRSRLMRGISRNGSAPPEAVRTSFASSQWTPLQQATTADLRTYLVDDILTKVDRASMLTSLEVRAPWLDFRIIDFAFGRVPDDLRATINERKILPRMLGARLLPPTLDLRRKQGFSLPLAAWLRGDPGKVFSEVLLESEVFDRKLIRSLIENQRRNIGFRNEHRLFMLAFFELWRREYRASL